jgi:hypothetical protein
MAGGKGVPTGMPTLMQVDRAYFPGGAPTLPLTRPPNSFHQTILLWERPTEGSAWEGLRITGHYLLFPIAGAITKSQEWVIYMSYSFEGWKS